MSNRDIGNEILEGIRSIKKGEGRTKAFAPPEDIRAIRKATGLTQSEFAALLAVSERTLQDWEQHRRTPSGAAVSLLRVAQRHPAILKEIAETEGRSDSAAG